MNVDLLRQRDEQEWQRSGAELWTIAITAARLFLFRRQYSEEDQKDLAQQVLIELSLNGIARCRTEENVSRWIWGRSGWRAIDLRRKRRRERKIIQEEGEQIPDEEGQERDLPQGAVPAVELSLKALADELVALARLSPAGFSKSEEAAFREIIIEGMKQKEFVEKYGLPLGTVGGLVTSARSKIISVLREGGERFWRF